jgi:hypothetical protein
MTSLRKAVPFAAVLALFTLVAAFGLAPWGASGADHLDAPGPCLTRGEAQLDINDLYVFDGSDPNNIRPFAKAGEDGVTEQEDALAAEISSGTPLAEAFDLDSFLEQPNPMPTSTPIWPGSTVRYECFAIVHAGMGSFMTPSSSDGQSQRGP